MHKGADFAALLAAVEVAARASKKGDPFVAMPQRVVGDAVDDGQADGDGGCPLSARQLEVLLLAARGLSNLRIGRLLCLSEAIVKRHLANAYERMGVHSRTEATAAALSKGWITERELVAYPPVRGPRGLVHGARSPRAVSSTT